MHSLQSPSFSLKRPKNLSNDVYKRGINADCFWISMDSTAVFFLKPIAFWIREMFQYIKVVRINKL